MVGLGDQQDFQLVIVVVGEVADPQIGDAFAWNGNLATVFGGRGEHDQLITHQDQGWQLQLVQLVVAAGRDLGAQAEGFTYRTGQGQGDAAKAHGLISQNAQHHFPFQGHAQGFAEHAQAGR